MRREITTAVPLPPGGDHDAVLCGDPSVWLPGGRPQGPHLWSFDLVALGWSRPVLCEVGLPVRSRTGPSRRLAWYPVTRESDLVAGDKWLPGFAGDLRLVGEPVTPSLVLIGEALLPFGLVGAALDAVALRAVADRSIDDLLQRIAAAIVEQSSLHGVG